jgi:hypothetical protein
VLKGPSEREPIMSDKPEMSAEERAKLKAELLAEIKDELKPKADSENLARLKEAVGSEYHPDDYLSYREPGETEEEFLQRAEWDEDHPYFDAVFWHHDNEIYKDKPYEPQDQPMHIIDFIVYSIWGIVLFFVCFFAILFAQAR